MTPPRVGESNVLLAALLLGLAMPLALFSDGALRRGPSRAVGHVGRVLLPNVVLLVVCLGGLLPSADGTGPWPACVAVMATLVIVATLRWARDPGVVATAD
jgi:hypothetical protein